MTICYTADLHFGYENVIEFCIRPFKSVQEMDGALLDHIRRCIRPQDEIWILGDFAFGPLAKNRDYLSYVIFVNVSLFHRDPMVWHRESCR